MAASDFTTLQSMMWPDLGICPDASVALRLHPGATLLGEGQAVVLGDGGVVGFDTAFNLFPLRKWQTCCNLQDLWLKLTGTGQVLLSVTAAHADAAADPDAPPTLVARKLLSVPVDLSPNGATIDLSDATYGLEEAALCFTLQAIGRAELQGAAWQTQQMPQRQPKLVLGITTFKREAEVTAAVDKFQRFAADWTHGADLHLVVVDNGQTVTLPKSDKVTLVPNRNLGGSGGFARCLREARKRGASHALFMDDDASIDMLAIERVWAMLAYAIDPATTVIGGLTQAASPSQLWECGATFNRTCRPQFHDLDLTSLAEALTMETTKPPPFNFYGGFWFFAFPLVPIRHWPFPFFVRGDDINFSIANPFSFVTLPGVVSFQDQDFADKESALTLYLDLRNHFIQHLTLPKMDSRFRTMAVIGLFFFARSLIQLHLDSLLSQNMALEDVMRGPAFFAANADMVQRRADIAALRRYEVWQPLEGAPPKARAWINPKSVVQRTLMKVSLNGLFLPFFGSWGNHLVLRRNQRGESRLCWGAASVSYVDTKRQQIMTVRHDKLAMLRLGFRSVGNLIRLALHFRKIKAEWRSGYEGLTTEAFWEKQFFTDPQKQP